MRLAKAEVGGSLDLGFWVDFFEKVGNLFFDGVNRGKVNGDWVSGNKKSDIRTNWRCGMRGAITAAGNAHSDINKKIGTILNNRQGGFDEKVIKRILDGRESVFFTFFKTITATPAFVIIHAPTGVADCDGLFGADFDASAALDTDADKFSFSFFMKQ